MAVAHPRVEKMQNLPLLCVETILKFTPTSKLTRLYSNAVPLPGASWNLGLDTVLENRLPLSLCSDREPYHQARGPTAVFDAAGANVASVKHREMLRFSPILEFIEIAFLTVSAVVERNARGKVLLFYACDGEAVLSNLQNVRALSLVLYEGQSRFDPKDFLASNLKHLLPQLESFVVKQSQDIGNQSWVYCQTVSDFLCALPMHEMTRLRRLHVPSEAFRSALDRSVSRMPDLSGLNSLGIWQSDYMIDVQRADVLRFVSNYCRELTVLSIFVCGEFKPYLDAFRALTGLKTLGMNLKLSTFYNRMIGLTFDGSEAISSVSDLRVVSDWMYYNPDKEIFKILKFFPNAKTVAIQAGTGYDLHALKLASFLFGERQFFPAAAELGCFFSDEMSLCPGVTLMEWLSNPRLPDAVDLSQIIFEDMAYDAGLLTVIFISMQSNSIKRLLLRGPLHRDALHRLQDRIDLLGENVKVSAWKDRDLGDHPGILNLTKISEQTDIKILGTKDSGSLKGQQFTIRIFHQLAKRVAVFD